MWVVVSLLFLVGLSVGVLLQTNNASRLASVAVVYGSGMVAQGTIFSLPDFVVDDEQPVKAPRMAGQVGGATSGYGGRQMVVVDESISSGNKLVYRRYLGWPKVGAKEASVS
ncbi:hypothetical protein SLEP1_g31571 [Rubroshorea leprosula]|uniref:Uncharacterized protein n=1 Tax=Rubroshorea leprosula TaxID=152421 RepID=A0AAV5K3R7_9ROSI|nr:hypothetical protein SLEP1_g31571 [Rubroshorea leprosula]